MNVFIVWLLVSIAAVGLVEEGVADQVADSADNAYQWSKDQLVKD